MTATDETDLPLETEWDDHRSPHVLMTIAGAVGLAAAFVLTIDKFTLLQNKIDGVESALSCDFSAFVSCGGVMDSPQAEAFGFPNSLLGIIGFSIVMTLGVILWTGGGFGRFVWGGLQVGVLFGIGFVTWLQFQSIYRLDLLCPYCMVVWAVMIPLFVHVTACNLRGIAPSSALTRFMSNWSVLIVALWYVGVASAIWLQFGERLWA
ncbi:MAG: vitamin K epoxide reductase family protein [Aeromicrobium sp.]